ncbi:Beta-lactamase [Pseudidiomarina piscicola]|uniref:Beta-lactamase n=1 Tax=Pseudidiomarina piscicola TaxID=2614830 RepID=A0A6S6WU37_9GAMM|nr:serine hydrolase domain-containing protein [Pseudidiomarina piscicola]CAB0150591.1 Beta-lactamase [Pseudidiomarina piscicola]VZT40092.1 Beta-lactamase [Pseudomonas aeruginosa]
MRKLIFCALLAFASNSYASVDDGTWRGELEFQENFSLVIGFKLADGVATFASPNQGLYEHPVSDYELTDSHLTFTVDDLQVSFSGELSGDRIEGSFTQGQTFPLQLQKLTTEDLQRLDYEAQYAGNLDVNGSELPLQLNIAVVAGDYLGTLDSPAQQTYGIPLADVQINDSQLKFTAPMIKAVFKGETDAEGAYVGAWHQGMAMPLTLRRVSDDHPAPEFEAAGFGEKGGAIAVLTPTGNELSYFGDHDAQTRYEIGSVTKTFISYLLADAVERGQVALNTPLQSLIPEAPTKVTLEQLATHTSGFPRLPGDLFDAAKQHDPYAHYDRQHLRNALSKLELQANQHLYSNFAVGTLAEALAIVNESDLAQLLEARVFEPFNMTDAQLAIAGSAVDKQLALPYDGMGNQVAPWRFKALAGAGGIVATLPDMVAYVEGLQQRLQQQPQLRELLLTPRTEFGSCCQQALGWFLQTDDAGKVYAWHNGQTGGFASYVGFYLDGSRAVVMLNNQSSAFNEEARNVLTQPDN